MAYGEIIIYRNWAASNPLIFRPSPNDKGLVCRPINRDERIGDRAPTGFHRLSETRVIREFEIEAWAVDNDWIVLAEYVKQSSDRFAQSLDGHLILEDWINYVPQSFGTINNRATLSGSTVSTGRGINKILCAYRVVCKEPAEEFISPEVAYSLTFRLEEA